MAAARTLNSSPPNVMLSHTHTHTHNFIHLWEKAAQLYAKNESENLTNQQHKTLKRYLAQSAQWRHILFSDAENFYAIAANVQA